MTTYTDFLARKAQFDGDAGFDPIWMPDQLFDFQTALVEWAIRRGRGALFADCGLGKTLMQLAWAENVRLHTGRPVIVAAPLAVTFQVEEEAAKFGIEAATSRDGAVVAGVTVTNYDHLFDSADFAGAVCDESSAIKAFDGKRRALVTEFMRQMRFRLLSTATAAPNDYTELGTSSEALGQLGYMDMLSRFFVNDGKVPHGHHRRGPDWRFKGHAEEQFWRWVASWGRAMRKPSDLGFSDDGFELPPLEQREVLVAAATEREGTLFDGPAVGLHEEREELRRTLDERCERAADLLEDAEPGVAWCQLNDESALLTKLIDGAVEVRGSDPSEVKEEKLAAFGRGDIRVLVTKPKIGAWGLNWQHCHRATFFPSHSYEQYYQAVRRFWRFGQTEPVRVDLVTTEGGAGAMENLRRKGEQADRMFEALVAHMRDGLEVQRTDDYDEEVEVPAWLAMC
jgi:hypothetical protein